MRKTYLFILLGFLLVVILGQLWDHGDVTMWIFADVPTILLMVLLFVPTMLATKSAKKFVRGCAFALDIKIKNFTDKTPLLYEYRECLEAVRFAIRVLLLGGCLITSLGCFNIGIELGNMEELAILVSFLVAFNGILYGLIGCFLLLPIWYGLKEKIINYVPEEIVPNEQIDPEIRMAKVYFSLMEMGLTAREAEVGRLIVCRELSNREIAEELFISELTVKKHVQHIFEKLGIAGREEIAELILKQQT